MQEVATENSFLGSLLGGIGGAVFDDVLNFVGLDVVAFSVHAALLGGRFFGGNVGVVLFVVRLDNVITDERQRSGSLDQLQRQIVATRPVHGQIQFARVQYAWGRVRNDD